MVGKRKTQEERDHEMISSYLTKLLKYNKHLEIMRERNSYSKTNHNATFVRMKNNHMLHGQLSLHATYN